MNKLILVIVLVLGIVISLSAQEIPLVFDKNRIDVGTMYVYEYSRNKEDSEPDSKAYLYIKTLNDIEIIRIPVNRTKATHLYKYKMNWDYMMFDKKESLSLKNKDEISIGATLKGTYKIDFRRSVLQLNFTRREENGFKDFNRINKFKGIPTYFYHITDLLPLWFTLRFYPFEERKISVYHNDSGFNTRLDIKYMNKEEIEVPYGKVVSYKFELVPRMSFFMKIISKPEKAWIWLTSEDDRRYMVKYRNNNIRSTFTRTMEYRLAEIKKITPEEWEEFKDRSGALAKE